MMRNAEWIGSRGENLCFRITEKTDAHQNTVCKLGADNVFKKQNTMIETREFGGKPCYQIYT